MPSLRFSLHIPADLYVSHYRGSTKSVSVLAEDGRRVEFPAEHLRPFVTRDGVYGRFELEFGEQGRFVALRRL
ncbi:MAG: DUF2835 domain-containing protein [Chromatiales bacterium]|nr:DUF2835 domain-containing protein [Chromatiales bacterium]